VIYEDIVDSLWCGLPFCRLPGAPREGTWDEAALIYPIFHMSQEHNGFSAPTRDEIALCAYLIWEREFWLQAETQLMATRAHDGWTKKANYEL